MFASRGHSCSTRRSHTTTAPRSSSSTPPCFLLTMVAAILGYQLSFETCRAYFEKHKPDVRRPIGPTPSYSILNDPEPEKFANSITAVQVTGVIATDFNRKLGITDEYRRFRAKAA
ncbi:hypothetical protein C8Q77DRAFT_1209164 [Trametes polyzona]|nr:hypothetical protein C8Q77DRAFT_1209164 [Trametes polyzona]